ncbi:unnamed protein product [Thelazia callipaeda]|uniref:Transport and Golgi organization protein 2 homolog n=1 Tax=Thelazia callipaeda TaxID=103827 RepID=A0A158RCK1_THECL|nr:unnamed protein product [Thelazia callipaeda]
MCVTFVYISQNPDAKYKLILINNRDEFLDRPTSNATWENGILAGGRDEKENERGTWFCMAADGRISNLLTITVPLNHMKKDTVTRGVLPINFLKNECDQYEMTGLVHHSNEEIEIIKFPPGIYGFGNSPPYEPFKKVQYGVGKMKKIVEDIENKNFSDTEIIEKLLQLATDKYQCFPDEQLRQRCGRSNEICKYRTAIFVQYPDGIRYGTRSHTITIVDRSNRVTYYEKSMKSGTTKVNEATWTHQLFHFHLT